MNLRAEEQTHFGMSSLAKAALDGANTEKGATRTDASTKAATSARRREKKRGTGARSPQPMTYRKSTVRKLHQGK